jgi:DNA-binding GntR family transcriptional regulator
MYIASMAPRKGRDLSADQQFTGLVQNLSGGYKTVGQMVYAVLREAILSGAFSPGDWLRQESLAEAIGVSRIPVRTALLQLESEGMITFHPHRGARVRTLTPEQIDEIYRLRTLLETYALARASRQIEPERLARLRRLAVKLDRQRQGSGFLDLRIEFYRELYEASSNPLLVELIDDLRNHVGRYYLGIKASHQNHVDLVNKLEEGSVDGAIEWLTSHFDRVRQSITEIAAESDVDEDEDGHPAAAERAAAPDAEIALAVEKAGQDDGRKSRPAAPNGSKKRAVRAPGVPDSARTGSTRKTGTGRAKRLVGT